MVDLKMFKLFDLVINGKELDLANLKKCGFSQKEILDLKFNRIISSDNSFKAVNELFEYGLKLEQEAFSLSVKIESQKKSGKHSREKIDDLKKQLTNYFEKAFKCFLKCYELEPDNYDFGLKLFTKYISKKDYDQALGCLEAMVCCANSSDYTLEQALYLYLLGLVSELPDKYKGMNLIGLLESFKGKPGKDSIFNNVLVPILEHRFPYALKLIGEYEKKNVELDLESSILKLLVVRVNKKQQKDKKRILKLLETNSISEINDYLNDKYYKHGLSVYESYVLILVRQILEIEKTSEVPEIMNFGPDNLGSAIEGNNYGTALEFSNNHNREYGVDSKSDILNILLMKINNMIEFVVLEQLYENEYERFKLYADSLGKEVSTQFDDIGIWLGFFKDENDMDYYNAFLEGFKIFLGNYGQDMDDKDLELGKYGSKLRLLQVKKDRNGN